MTDRIDYTAHLHDTFYVLLHKDLCTAEFDLTRTTACCDAHAVVYSIVKASDDVCQHLTDIPVHVMQNDTEHSTAATRTNTGSMCYIPSETIHVLENARAMKPLPPPHSKGTDIRTWCATHRQLLTRAQEHAYTVLMRWADIRSANYTCQQAPSAQQQMYMP